MLARFVRWVETTFLAAAVIMLVVMVVSTLCQVAFRYLLALPLAWTEELSRLALICAVYAALPAAYVRGEHIAVDFFARKLPTKAFHAYVILLKAITFLVISYFAYGAYLQIGATWRMTFISLPMLPIGAMYLVQFVALAFFSLLVLITWRDPEVYLPTSHEGIGS